MICAFLLLPKHLALQPPSTPSTQDISTRFISYWTDNGAYYYYATEPNKTYQQTVIDAVAYERSIGIPVATLQVS